MIVRGSIPRLVEGDSSRMIPYVPPSSRCVKILSAANMTDDSNNTTTTAAVAIGNNVQLLQVEHVAAPPSSSSSSSNESNNDAAASSSSLLRIRGGVYCSVVGRQDNKGVLAPAHRIGSIDQLSPDRLVVAASAGDDSLGVISVDWNQMAVEDHHHHGNPGPRRRGRRGASAESGEDSVSAGAMKLVSSMRVPASSFQHQQQQSLFCPTTGSQFVGVDALLGSAVVAVTRGAKRGVDLVDLSASAVVSSVPLDGFPVASCSIANNSTSLLAVSTGNFVTLWDARCPASATSGGKCVTALSAAAVPQSQAGGGGDQSGSSSSNRSPLFAPDTITSVCGVDGPGREHYLVTGGSDRAVVLWDMRKWSKQSVQQNSLKFAPGSIAVGTVTDGGIGATAAGTDSEARTVALPFAKSGGGAQQQQQQQKKGNNNSNNKAEEAVFDEMQVGGSFRQRLQNATHCATTWHGSWNGCAKKNVAIGVASNYELFLTSFKKLA